MDLSICCGEVLLPYGGPHGGPQLQRSDTWNENCVTHMFMQVVFRKDIGCIVSVADDAFFSWIFLNLSATVV